MMNSALNMMNSSLQNDEFRRLFLMQTAAWSQNEPRPAQKIHDFQYKVHAEWVHRRRGAAELLSENGVETDVETDTWILHISIETAFPFQQKTVLKMRPSQSKFAAGYAPGYPLLGFSRLAFQVSHGRQINGRGARVRSLQQSRSLCDAAHQSAWYIHAARLIDPEP